jgi:hypothetical protein
LNFSTIQLGLVTESEVKVRHQPEGATGAEFGVCHLKLARDAADREGLFAPVKLERFTQLEFERDEGGFAGDLGGLIVPAMDIAVDA